MQILTSVINNYLNHCKIERNLSIKTIKAYNCDLKQFLKFITPYQINKIEEVNKDQIKAFLVFLTNFKPKSVKRKMASIKGFFDFLEIEEYLQINPLRRLRIKIKEPKTLPKTLDIHQINKIYRKAYFIKNQQIDNKNEIDYFEHYRNVVIIEILFATGARVSELSVLLDKNVNLENGEITLFGKGQKERKIHICNFEVIQILRNYRAEFSRQMNLSGGYFFTNRNHKQLSEQSIRLMIKRIAKLADIQMKVTPHTFRHTFATLLLENDVDIRYIQTLMGHSSISTTQIYTHTSSIKQKLILSSKHPRNDISFK
jgi:integrase/recombinase XerD